MSSNAYACRPRFARPISISVMPAAYFSPLLTPCTTT
jgi:hypothetical protein